MKKRVLAMVMAICIGAIHTTGAYAAAAEGTAAQIATEEESFDDGIATEAVMESDEDATAVDSSEEFSEETGAESAVVDDEEEGGASEESSDTEDSASDEAPVQAEEDFLVVEEPSEIEPTEDADSDNDELEGIVEETHEEDLSDLLDGIAVNNEASEDDAEIVDDAEAIESINSAMNEIIESSGEIEDHNQMRFALSADAQENMQNLINYISRNGKYSSGNRVISLDPSKTSDGSSYFPAIILNSSDGYVLFGFELDYSNGAKSLVFLEYSISKKEFGYLYCSYENSSGTLSFDAFAAINPGTYTNEQDLIFNVTSKKVFTDSQANEMANITKDGAFIQWEMLLRKKANMSLYSIGFNKYVFFDLVDCQMSSTSFLHTGSEIKPSINVTYAGSPLKQGTHYQLEYKNNVNVGTATVNVNAIGGLSGTKSLSFKILPAASKKVTIYNVAQGIKVTWLAVEGATRYYVYRDGEQIKTTSGLEITDGDVKYRSGEKFTYKVVATAKNVGDSTAARTGTYYRLMPVGIKSVTNSGAGKMTVTYDYSAGSSGYVVRYGLKSDMSDAKVITVKGENTLSRTFSNLTKGKTYYVQVRTYKIDNGIRYYSGYCTTKTVNIVK